MFDGMHNRRRIELLLWFGRAEKPEGGKADWKEERLVHIYCEQFRRNESEHESLDIEKREGLGVPGAKGIWRWRFWQSKHLGSDDRGEGRCGRCNRKRLRNDVAGKIH
jgi:hypothetical protein